MSEERVLVVDDDFCVHYEDEFEEEEAMDEYEFAVKKGKCYRGVPGINILLSEAQKQLEMINYHSRSGRPPLFSIMRTYENMTRENFLQIIEIEQGMGRYDVAIGQCEQGIRKFPKCIEIWTEKLDCVSAVGDSEKIAEAYDYLMNKVVRESWRERTYEVVLNHLIREAFDNEKTCRSLLAEFRGRFPHSEMSYWEESLLEEELNNKEASLDVLEAVINDSEINAPRCAVKLIEIQMERGKFAKALRTCDYFDVACNSTQVTYHLIYEKMYMKALCEQALLTQNRNDWGSVPAEEVEELQKKNRRLFDINDISLKHFEKIKAHKLLLIDIPTTLERGRGPVD